MACMAVIPGMTSIVTSTRRDTRSHRYENVENTDASPTVANATRFAPASNASMAVVAEASHALALRCPTPRCSAMENGMRRIAAVLAGRWVHTISSARPTPPARASVLGTRMTSAVSRVRNAFTVT